MSELSLAPDFSMSLQAVTPLLGRAVQDRPLMEISRSSAGTLSSSAGVSSTMYRPSGRTQTSSRSVGVVKGRSVRRAARSRSSSVSVVHQVVLAVWSEWCGRVRRVTGVPFLREGMPSAGW